jgi:hypothetical protein
VAAQRRASADGGERRQGSPVSSISGSGARFKARRTPACSAQSGEATTRGGESGGDATERPDDAAARLGNSGETSRELRRMRTMTGDAGVKLTSRCSSRAASRRRGSDGGGDSKAAAEARVWLRRRTDRQRRRLG